MDKIREKIDKIIDMITEASLALEEFKDDQESVIDGIMEDVDDEEFEGSDLQEQMEDHMATLEEALDCINKAWDLMEDLPEFEY